MTKPEYLEFHKKFCKEMIVITEQKNHDYTGGSTDPFANFKGVGHLVDLPGVVEIGFITRMSDKMARIGSFISRGTLEVKEESVVDTLKDLANYAALFAGYLESEKEIKNEKSTTIAHTNGNAVSLQISSGTTGGNTTGTVGLTASPNVGKRASRTESLD